MKHTIEKNKAKFAKHVKREGECLIWQSTKDKAGYGTFQFRDGGQKFKIRAHRAAYMLAGHDLQETEVIRHTCDTPACVNPAHLRAGSHADNVGDRVAKGRSARGADNGRATMSAAQVEAARRLRQSGGNMSAFARRNGLNESTVRKAASGISWGPTPD